MNSRFTGSVFLIIGTTIGAGILSLPLIVASCGFTISLILLIMSWSVMYITSIKLLNVFAEYPLGVNFTTIMLEKVPKIYLFFFSIIYLLLLYSLLLAYTTQGSSLISKLCGINDPIQSQIAIFSIIFILIFGSFLFSYRVSDYVNRFLVILKFIFFIIVIIIMIFYINVDYLINGSSSISSFIFAWPTLLPAFGFHNIIPVIYEYQKGDVTSIKRSIFIGSLCVLIVYLVWICLFLAFIPQNGLYSYHGLFISGNNTPNGLVNEIKRISESNILEISLNLFINIAVITSFIGVAISLIHYIKDIFIRYNKNIGILPLALICFVPPLIFTIFYPKGFILALQYAAIFAVIIFVYTPSFLDTKKNMIVYVSHIYAVFMGSSVIIFEVLNLYIDPNPFIS